MTMATRSPGRSPCRVRRAPAIAPARRWSSPVACRHPVPQRYRRPLRQGVCRLRQQRCDVHACASLFVSRATGILYRRARAKLHSNPVALTTVIVHIQTSMIRSFRSRALRRFAERGEERRIHAEHRETARTFWCASTRRPRRRTWICPASGSTAEGRLRRILVSHGARQLARNLSLSGRPRRRCRLSRLPLEGPAMLIHDPPTQGPSSGASASNPSA